MSGVLVRFNHNRKTPTKLAQIFIALIIVVIGEQRLLLTKTYVFGGVITFESNIF